MKLYTAGASPFGRKVKVAAHELGLIDRLEIANETVSPVAPSEAVARANPLGKIPCLVLDDGTALYDSRVICEHLDLLGGGRLFPPEGRARLRALTLQALADGLMDAGVSARYETFFRPEPLRWAGWVAAQKLKITRALDRLEADAAALGGLDDIGAIAVACALGYLDFRFPDDAWRDRRAALASWYEGVAERPSMQATRPD